MKHIEDFPINEDANDKENRLKYYSGWHYSVEFNDKVWLDKTGIHIPCKIEERSSSKKVIVEVPKPLFHPKYGMETYRGERNEILRYTAHNTSPVGGYYTNNPVFNLILYEY